MMTAWQPIERSPADVLRLVVASVAVATVLLVEWLFGATLVGFASDLFRGLDALPTLIVQATQAVTRALGASMVVGLLLWASYRRRWRMLVTVAVAGLSAIAINALLHALVETDQGADLVDVDVDLGPLTTAGFPSRPGIAAVAAILTAAAPWLGRWWRRAGWVLILGLIVTGFVELSVSIDPVLALAVGWWCGAAVLVVSGAPARRPSSQAVIDGLGAVGLPVQQLDRAGVDARGSTPYFGVGVDGSRLFVKALGVDERSADLLFRVYRGLQPRHFGDERPFSTLRRAVEHEAFVALTASTLGVRTPALRAFATAVPNGYVLAYEAIDGRSLDRLDRDQVSDEVLASIWQLVAQLRRYRIAHRDLRLANIFLDDEGHVWLIDFGFSEVAAADLLLATDVAELLASSTLCVGTDRAVAAAVNTVDPLMLAKALERLHPWSLSGATRTALKSDRGLLEGLRQRVSDRSRRRSPIR